MWGALHLGLGSFLVSDSLRVSSFIINGSWNFSRDVGLIPDLIQVRICNCHIPFDLRPYKRAWNHSESGDLYLKEAFDFKNKISTNNQLKRRNFAFPFISSLCFDVEESSSHLFFIILLLLIFGNGWLIPWIYQHSCFVLGWYLEHLQEALVRTM